jgi:hypothetical protein
MVVIYRNLSLNCISTILEILLASPCKFTFGHLEESGRCKSYSECLLLTFEFSLQTWVIRDLQL